MYKSYFDKYKRELEKEFDDKLDVVGEHISSEGSNYAIGAYGEALKAIKYGNYKNSFNYHRPNKLTVENGNSADYSDYIEFGTGQRIEEWGINVVKYKNKKGKSISRTGMKPRPIQQTVIDSNDSEILDILSR